MIYTGAHAQYFWLQGPEADLEDLREACPAVFAGQHVVVTSFDSGPLVLTPEELDAGWRALPGAAASPALPFQGRVPGELFSEWWLYPSLPQWSTPPDVYVNYLGFSVAPPDREVLQYLTVPFWRQVLERRPESLFLNGGLTILITRRSEHVPLLSTWLHAQAAA